MNTLRTYVQKLRQWKIPLKWKRQWHQFFSEWNIVKYHYYGTKRHLRRHHKHCQKLREIGIDESVIHEYRDHETKIIEKQDLPKKSSYSVS